MGKSDKQWMKVSFVYDDGYVIQLQFAFRSSLRNVVPLHGKRSFIWQAFLEKRALELHGMVQTAKVRFLGSSPNKELSL